MGKLIKREGTFVGYALQSGVGKTRANSFPQFVAKLQAVQEYDFDSQQFIDITDVEEVEATGYFVLYGADKTPTLNAKQIKAAYPDLVPTIRNLNEANLSEVAIQFRVEEREYKGKTKFDVTWIDHADAIPGGSVGKADEDTIDELEATYAKGMRELLGGDKPKSVPTGKKITTTKSTTKPVVPRVAETPDGGDAEEPTNKELMKDVAKASIEEQKERAAEAELKAMSPKDRKTSLAKKAKPLTKPVVPIIKKAAPLEDAKETTLQQQAVEALDLTASCTQEEAWEACEENAHESKTETLAEAWTAVVEKFDGDDAVDANKAWHEVRDTVLAQVIDEK